MYELTSDTMKVIMFVKTIMVFPAAEGMKAIGLKRNGELIAGVVYEGFNGRNVWAHIAAVPGKRWMTKQFLLSIFEYPFVTLGVDRISLYVSQSNTASLNLAEHMGFKREAVLSGASSDGGDVILLTMWRGECKYVDSK